MCSLLFITSISSSSYQFFNCFARKSLLTKMNVNKGDKSIKRSPSSLLTHFFFPLFSISAACMNSSDSISRFTYASKNLGERWLFIFFFFSPWPYISSLTDLTLTCIYIYISNSKQNLSFYLYWKLYPSNCIWYN